MDNHSERYYVSIRHKMRRYDQRMNIATDWWYVALRNESGRQYAFASRYKNYRRYDKDHGLDLSETCISFREALRVAMLYIDHFGCDPVIQVINCPGCTMIETYTPGDIVNVLLTND